MSISMPNPGSSPFESLLPGKPDHGTRKWPRQEVSKRDCGNESPANFSAPYRLRGYYPRVPLIFHGARSAARPHGSARAGVTRTVTLGQ